MSLLDKMKNAAPMPPASFFFFFCQGRKLRTGLSTGDLLLDNQCFFGGVNRPILLEHQVLGLLHYTGGDVFTRENSGPVPEDSHQPPHTPPLPFQLIGSQKKMSLSSPNGTWVTFSEQRWKKNVSPHSYFDGNKSPKPMDVVPFETKAGLFTVSSTLI